MGMLLLRLMAWLHLGRLPATVRAQLESEGRILYLVEGIMETAIWRGYRAPGAAIGERRIAFIGYFALAERRLVAKAKQYHEVNVNVAYDDPRFKAMTFTVRPRYLALAFDASAQGPQSSGQMEVRLHLPDIAAATKILEQAGARIVSNGL
jgi:hypothetical protein